MGSLIAAALADIQSRNPETFGPELVRDEARPEGHPLHPFVFDKDVEEAAEEYYLDRARDLIQSAHVTIVNHDETPRLIRAYIAIPGKNQPYVFTPVTTVMGDPGMARAALTEAIRRVNAAQKAVDDLDAVMGTAPVKRAKRRLSEATGDLAQA